VFEGKENFEIVARYTAHFKYFFKRPLHARTLAPSILPGMACLPALPACACKTRNSCLLISYKELQTSTTELV